MSVRVHALRALLVVSLTFAAIAATPLKKAAAASCPSCLACAGDTQRPRALQVWLFNQSRLKDADIADILETANRIWMPYGISMVPENTAEAIKVVVSAQQMRSDTSSQSLALGDTLFSNGHATPYMHLWLGGAEALAVGAEIEGRTFTSRSLDERDAILRQMLGVALAHELAHYLLDSSSHSSAGLLRPTLGVDDLAHPRIAHLRLTADQQRLMCSRDLAPLTAQDRTAAETHRSN